MNKIKQKLQKFTKLTGIKIEVQNEKTLAAPGITFDALIVLSIGKLQFPFWIEENKAKSSVESIERKHRLFPNMIVIGSLSPKQRSYFNEKKIAFITYTGDFKIPINIYSNNSINGTKSIKKAPILSEPKISSNKIKPSGKGVFLLYFLSSPEYQKVTQREIAKQTGLSLAAINLYLKQLQQQGYLIQDLRRRRLLHPERLLDQLVFEFEKRLQLNSNQSSFKLSDLKLYKILRSKKEKLEQGYWGGVKAADIITLSELPEKLTIYTDSKLAVIKELRLLPDQSGPIIIREKFWSFPWPEKVMGIVPLPLVYVELILSSDPRDYKAAEFVKSRILNEII